MRKLLKVSLFAVIFLFLIVSFWYLLMLWCPPWWGKFFYPLKYEEEIALASQKYKLDPYLISAIIYEESRFNPLSCSRVGARGLMQVLPSTAKWIANQRNLKDFDKNSLYEPKTNIDTGSWYFSYLLKEYKSETLALAAYNGGRKNLDRWLEENEHLGEEEFVKNIPFTETRKFIYKVRETRKKYQRIYPDVFERRKKK